MLYCGLCDLCGYLLVFEDIGRFKQEIGNHFDTSHKGDFGCFCSGIPLKEFEQIFIWKIRGKQQIMQIKEAMKNPLFWQKQRNVVIPLFAEANRRAKALALAR